MAHEVPDQRERMDKRVSVSRTREVVDALTGLLYLIPGVGTVADETIDVVTNLATLGYNMWQSPYLPGRGHFRPLKLALDYGLNAAATVIELFPGINDMVPGHYLASTIMRKIYERDLRKARPDLYEEPVRPVRGFEPGFAPA